ncbi:terminase TerL endonuclease subunit [uncultured Sphingomonas sp.]|uniref:terminase large subunit n=1 Tax=uncultured Sphingomonas sp. TaxID=158754 RepID=UPI0025EC959F|nr:terminase TerL endonuclease subunit [uncultured Sphingomonas sp.]
MSKPRRFPKSSYSWHAQAYAKNVLSGKQPACWQVKAQCQRYLDDFGRDDIYYDVEAVDHVCNFIEHLVHTKAEWAGKPIKLEPFQLFILANLFGWLITSNGLRRYREALIMLPRKNGKSLLAAAIALYMTLADGESGAEGYIGATSEKQANEVFVPAQRMASMSPGLTEALDIDVMAQSIFSKSTNSSIQRVIANTKDGSSPHFACCDEVHEARDDTQYAAFKTGLGSRSQPLLLLISTAGTNTAGICFTLQRNAEAVLTGLKRNDRLFAMIYTIDDGDDWREENSWRKANPNWGVSIKADFLQEQLADALQSPANQAMVKTKHLNIWVASANGWLSGHLWASGVDETKTLEDFKGHEAYLAADISTRQDLTAISLVVLDGDKRRIFPIAHLPQGALEGSPNAPSYREWIDTGFLTTTEGNASDFVEIEEKIMELCRDYKIVKAVFDPWQGEFLTQKVQALGIPAETWPASAPALWTKTLDDFEADLKNGLIKHPNHPVMNWCAANISISEKGVTRIPVKPSKSQRHQKIDVMIASLMAYAVSQEEVPEAMDMGVVWF